MERCHCSKIKPMMRQLFNFIVISLLLSACAPAVLPVTETPTQQPPPTATPFACQPSKILKSPDSPPEIQGTMKSDGEVWALLFFDQAKVNEEEKIVWRITGGGELTIQAQNAEGTILSPTWGPEYHDSSSWTRPGQEWGTGFTFPKAGCWVITVTRGSTIGEIALDVIP